MACINPPELRDSHLIAYLDDRSSNDVARHLARCEHCRANLRRLAALENRLTALLYRGLCPAPETLGEYNLKMLNAEPAAAIADHVAGCPHCIRELAQLNSFMNAVKPSLEVSPIERIKVLIARLIEGGAAGGQMAPALAGVRGEADDGAYVYDAGDAHIVIHVQDDEDAERKKILGFISGVDAEGAEVVLYREEERITTTTVDDLNNFVVSELASGPHEIVIRTNHVEIHVQGVTV